MWNITLLLSYENTNILRCVEYVKQYRRSVFLTLMLINRN